MPADIRQAALETMRLRLCMENERLSGAGEPPCQLDAGWTASLRADGSWADVAYEDADLRAHKAWFLFNDGMVALGAGITATGDVLVRPWPPTDCY